MNLFLFFSTVFIWGTTWIAIALQLGPVPVLTSVFYRFALAGAVFILALLISGRLKLPSLTQQPYILMQALCLFSFNFICFYNATAYVPSGLVSVIFSLATIYNTINARLFFGERITKQALFAALLGTLGLLLLFGKDIFASANSDYIKGIGFAALGTLFFSLGNMVSKRNSANGISPIIANAWGMVYGACILFGLILISKTPVILPTEQTYLLALTYLAIVGSVIGFTTYLMMVARVGATKAAYATVLFPVVALSLSTLFENYHWHWTGFLGLALVMAGNGVMFAKRTTWARVKAKLSHKKGPAPGTI